MARAWAWSKPVTVTFKLTFGMWQKEKNHCCSQRFPCQQSAEQTAQPGEAWQIPAESRLIHPLLMFSSSWGLVVYLLFFPF